VPKAVIPKYCIILFPFYKMWISVFFKILYSSLHIYLLHSFHFSSNSQSVFSGPAARQLKNFCRLLPPIHFFLVNQGSIFSLYKAAVCSSCWVSAGCVWRVFIPQNCRSCCFA